MSIKFKSLRRTQCVLLPLAFAAFAFGAAPNALATTFVANAAVAIVKVPRPWYAFNWLVERKMRETVAQYQAIDGLQWKAYSFAEPSGEFGGIYGWRDMASAQAWFNPSWFTRIREQRGVDGKVRLFESLAVHEIFSLAANDNCEAVATLNFLSAPSNRASLHSQLPALIAGDKARPGLIRANYLIANDAANSSRLAVLHIWRNRKAAAREVASFTGTVEWFTTPIITIGNKR